jgi:hypothetical protein
MADKSQSPTPTSSRAPGSPSLKSLSAATNTANPTIATVSSLGSTAAASASSLSSTATKPFTFGSGKGSFGSGKGTFGSGGPISAFTPSNGSASVFGIPSSSKEKTAERDEDDENEEGDDDDTNAHEGYLEAQKKKLYEIQEGKEDEAFHSFSFYSLTFSFMHAPSCHGRRG